MRAEFFVWFLRRIQGVQLRGVVHYAEIVIFELQRRIGDF